MATFVTLEQIINSFPEVSVEPHFEKISFRIKKKIFATFDEKYNKLVVKFSEIDQEKFSSKNPYIYPVENKWGKQGWTSIELSEVNQQLLTKILTFAYCEVAPNKLADIVKTKMD